MPRVIPIVALSTVEGIGACIQVVQNLLGEKIADVYRMVEENDVFMKDVQSQLREAPHDARDMGAGKDVQLKDAVKVQEESQVFVLRMGEV
eukprot:augustus_masked-scaffold_3-processed-gene-11.42-mRNA-1 protein AED:0.44 eAED:1.00 QI:0/-1/0/1/-1/1/1/0/90